MEKFNRPDFIGKLQKTPDSAFSEITEELFPWFSSFIRGTYPTLAGEIRDILQDMAVKIAENANSLDPQRGTFLSWSFRVLRNLCNDRISKQRKTPMQSLEEATAGIEAEDVYPVPEHPQDFLTLIEKIAPESGLREAILKLRPKDCLIILMPLAGWSDDEIVEILSLESKNALWARRSRAMAQLKDEFEKINKPQRGPR